MTKEILKCSFCGKQKADTNLLIAGLDAHICDQCIDQAHGIVIEESKHQNNREFFRINIKKAKGNQRFFRQLYYWTRTNKKSHGCCCLQPLQKIITV